MNKPEATEPLTVDAKGKPPENRITTAAAAWKSFQEARQTGSLDDARVASLRGIYDGMPPVDPAELEQQGLQDMPNINLRQFSSKISIYASTWVDHDCGGDKWYEVQLKRENFEDLQAWRTASEYATECFNDAIRYWDDVEEQNAAPFVFERVISCTQMGIFGIGPMHFQDPIDWRPCAVPTRKVLPSRGSKVTLANCQALFIQKPYTVCQLYNYVRNEDVAKRTGWNRDAVIKLLYTKTRTAVSNTFETQAEWQNRVRNNDIFLQHDFRTLELVDMYVQEFNTSRNKDGITHYVIAEGIPEFLYEKDREYDRFSQIIIAFCDSTGPEGDWHGVKGFGDNIYDGCHLNNCFFNHIATTAIITSSPLFQSSTESDREKIRQTVFTRMGILFPDVQVSQLKINADINGALAVFSESNRIINQNSRSFPQNDAAPGGEQPTATQVAFDRQDQTQFTSLQIKFYRITGADRLGFEMFRRLSRPASKYPESWPGGKTAKWFREKMEKAGMNEKQYGEVKFVRASRNGGSGNMALDGYKADQAMGVATPGRGQLAARKEKVASLFGWERVPEFVEEPDSLDDREQPLIELENTTLQNGQFIRAFPFQLHDVHLGDPNPDGSGHLAVLSVTLEAARQIDEAGIETALADAVKLVKVLEGLVQHCGQHIEFMAQTPRYEEAVKQLNRIINDARQFTITFAQSVESAVQKSQQEQQGQQMDPKVQAILAKAQAEIEVLKAKTMAEIQLDGEKQRLRLEGMQETARSRHAIKEAEALQRMGVEAEKSLIDQQRQQIELKNEEKKAEAKTRAKKNTTKK